MLMVTHFFHLQVIFGTGDALQAITVSANVGFVRAAMNQVCIMLSSNQEISTVRA